MSEQETSETERATQHIQNMLYVPQLTARKVAEFSVGLLIVVNTIGFVITTYYYSRAGISASSIPISMMTAAGLSCVFFVLFWSYVGYAVGSAKKWLRRLELFVLGVGSIGLLSSVMSWYSPRFWTFGLFEGLSSYIAAARARRQRENPEKKSVVLVDPYHQLSHFLYPIASAAFFGWWLYPALPRTAGGARPQPVEVTWSSDALAQRFAGKKLYEVFEESSTVYLAFEKPVAPDPWPLQLLSFEEESLEFFSVPRSAVLTLYYLPRHPAPPSPSQVAGVNQDVGNTLPDAGKTASTDAGVGVHGTDAGVGVHGTVLMDGDGASGMPVDAGVTDSGVRDH